VTIAPTDLHAYPRPQLRRTDWTSLNGSWDFALDHDGRCRRPDEVAWNDTIRVPFSPETPASGVHETGFFRACWYRRTFEAPALAAAQRLILHFGAVDYRATIWVNGAKAVEHEGGYTPFEVDLTELLVAGPQTVVMRAEDDPQDLEKPRGKQDWQLHPHSIWYHRTSGIWQSVWLERVSPTYIGSLRWTSNLERWELGLDVILNGAERADALFLHLRLRIGELIMVDDTYSIFGGQVHRQFALSDPGIDDFRNELLWSPARPTLIEAELTLRDQFGAALDTVMSYTALRSIGVQGDRFMLNGRPYVMRLVLDQGYWPESGLTAPSDDALRRDVELAKAMGFNGVRKHQKIEDPRYLYWADRLGLLVWGEMPSAYRFTPRSVERLTREWTAAVERDLSHPCIVAWVPFNESWGVPDLAAIPAQRHYVQAIYHLTKTLDPSRPVIGNDGWESVATDIVGIHDYDSQPERIRRRYEAGEVLGRLFTRERPGGRLLTIEGHPHAGQPLMLTEFGGTAMSTDRPGEWGYSRAASPEDLAEQYQRLLDVITSLSLFAGFCYTQFADTYQEANGLLLADRTPKFPLDRMAAATSRPQTAYEELVQEAWRSRMLALQQQGNAAFPHDEY
jgi:beta-galactosidase/beta-glucuronidase